MFDWEFEGLEFNVGDIVFELFNFDGFIVVDVLVVDEIDFVVLFIFFEVGIEIMCFMLIVVEVIDEIVFVIVMIDVMFFDGVCELIYDGVSFWLFYVLGFMVVLIENGYCFML